MSTTIEWTDETWNPVTGCDRVSPGCDHCYAETIANRFKGTTAFPNGFAVTLHPDRLDAPLHWRKPRRVFVNSMSDLFHPDVPDEFIHDAWGAMAVTPKHTYQILTKRPQRMAAFMRANVERHGDGPMCVLPNVWLGVSVENQRYADLRIPHLLATPAAVRFLSCEPLLGPLRLTPYLDGLDWVIVGGESGTRARPMEPGWALSLRDQCIACGVPFFFKQWGGRTPKTNGRDLAGRTWSEYPSDQLDRHREPPEHREPITQGKATRG